MGDRRPERIHPIPRLQRIAESGNQRKGSHPCLAQVFLKPIGRGLREVERPKAVGELFETYVTCELLDIRSGDDESAPFTVIAGSDVEKLAGNVSFEELAHRLWS